MAGRGGATSPHSGDRVAPFLLVLFIFVPFSKWLALEFFLFGDGPQPIRPQLLPFSWASEMENMAVLKATLHLLPLLIPHICPSQDCQPWNVKLPLYTMMRMTQFGPHNASRKREATVSLPPQHVPTVRCGAWLPRPGPGLRAGSAGGRLRPGAHAKGAGLCSGAARLDHSIQGMLFSEVLEVGSISGTQNPRFYPKNQPVYYEAFVSIFLREIAQGNKTKNTFGIFI